MIYDLIAGTRFESLVGNPFVAVQGSSDLDMLFNLRLQALALAVGHNLCPDAAIAFQHSENDSLVLSSGSGNAPLPFAQVHVSSFPADESFVNLYLAAHLATEYIVLQGETNAVKHEPCGFLGNAQIAGEFAGANAALAVGQHPERGEPFIKANSGSSARLPTLTENSRLE